MYYALEKLKLVENWGTTDVVDLNMSLVFLAIYSLFYSNIKPFKIYQVERFVNIE
jgi:hypothetical protein